MNNSKKKGYCAHGFSPDKAMELKQIFLNHPDLSIKESDIIITNDCININIEPSHWPTKIITEGMYSLIEVKDWGSISLSC
ncbi:MAG: hypothetical protein V1684_01700 [bacterium]